MAIPSRRLNFSKRAGALRGASGMERARAFFAGERIWNAAPRQASCGLGHFSPGHGKAYILLNWGAALGPLACEHGLSAQHSKFKPPKCCWQLMRAAPAPCLCRFSSAARSCARLVACVLGGMGLMLGLFRAGSWSPCIYKLGAARCHLAAARWPCRAPRPRGCDSDGRAGSFARSSLQFIQFLYTKKNKLV